MMKKTIVFLTVMALSIGTEAKEVNQQTAAAKAVQLMESRIDDFNAKVASVTPVEYEGQRAYYVVQFAPQGWALISADDTSAPLIGYSPQGRFQTEDMPFNMQAQMDLYSREVVENAKKVGIQHRGWQTVEEPSQRAARRADKIAPLIKVNWNQSGAFKKYCPSDDKGQALVGCVAVGMAQAMSVAQWPPRPVGSYYYTSNTYGSLGVNYDNEPDYNWDAILSGANNKDDVARFLWHCGISVKMEYGVDGSGSQTAYIPGALQRNFQYPASVKYFSRDSYQGDWKELILTEIREGRAVAYSGFDPSKGYGHCFNLDGYDGQWFNVNWGWGGANNGYFGLDGLKDATMDMNYTTGQGAVVGFRAPSEYPMDIILSNLSVSSDATAGTEVADVTVESEASNPTYSFKVEGPKSIVPPFKRTSVPFEIKDMKLVTTGALTKASYNIYVTVTNTNNNHSLERTFTIVVTDPAGIVSINVADSNQSEYFSIDGQKLSSPQQGLNIVRQRQANGTVTARKIIVK